MKKNSSDASPKDQVRKVNRLSTFHGAWSTKIIKSARPRRKSIRRSRSFTYGYSVRTAARNTSFMRQHQGNKGIPRGAVPNMAALLRHSFEHLKAIREDDPIRLEL